jgi:hypothetical protein
VEEYPGREIWRRWILANAGGVVAGAVAGGLGGVAVALLCLLVCGYQAFLVGGVLAWLLFSATLGGAQQRVLFPYSSLAWTRASALGGMLALALGFFVGGWLSPDIPSALRTGAVAGAVVGLAQWRELRAATPRAAIWAPANALGWALGLAVAQVAGALLPRAGGPPAGDHQISDVIEAAGYPLLTGLLAAVVAAAFTGAALLWMQGAGREPAPSAGRPAG